ncbi:uncharacterized protein FTOL_06136 [Fusarium torulosum]|uniref:Uncharacterized protein n=1 Tax=Fusarium torulosum TaxID=33205 RepID=A0AAE8M8W1_9HYPO|nr:uncharacterized protein FTOL_06136 [Fusarium torulosum]
MPNEQIRD